MPQKNLADKLARLVISKKGDKEPDGGDGWEVSTPVDRIGSNTEREDTGSGSGGFLGNGEKDPNNSV